MSPWEEGGRREEVWLRDSRCDYRFCLLTAVTIALLSEASTSRLKTQCFYDA